jgi:hypothetical protein
MGHKDRRGAPRLPDPRQIVRQLATGQFIHRAKRLIEQQETRTRGKRPRDGRALAHAARQFRRPRVGKPVQTHQSDQLVDLGRLDAPPREVQCKLDVPAHAPPRQQRRVLKRHRKPGPPERCQRRRPVNGNRARAGALQPCHHPQKRRLSAA